MVIRMKNLELITAVAACMSLFSCSKTELRTSVGQVVIYAYRENIQSTKTEIQDGSSVVWKSYDAISLFVGKGDGGGNKFVSYDDGNSPSTSFRGNATIDRGSTLWAVYPYSETNSCDGSSVTAALPHTQIAKVGSFSDDLFLSVAKSTTKKMKFFNVCGGIKFSVNRDDIREVVISNNDGGMMCGTMKIIMNDQGIPEVESISNGSSVVRVMAPFGETFTRGSSYYAVVAPVMLSKGVTVTYMTTEGKEGAVTLPSSIVDRSVFSRLPDVEIPAHFDYSPYLTFTSDKDCDVRINTEANLEYSYDRINWTKVSDGLIGLTELRPFFLRGINSNLAVGNTVTSIEVVGVMAKRLACYGSIMKLLDYKNDCTIVPKYCFKSFFEKCPLTHAPELPATILSDYCYESMFHNCNFLESAPALPATTLARSCYENMFSDCCYYLKSAPELPATALADNCYKGMFGFCESLDSAPKLPATELADQCYSNMFENCTSLVSAPELPATALSNDCYRGMFSGCTSLESAPKLPATILTKYCYHYMFKDCISLVSAPDLPATTLTESCYTDMFNNCISLVSAPELPATTLAKYCYDGMFQDCQSLIFVPDLPATTLASYCYNEMFMNCKSLTSAPDLIATTLSYQCYGSMFEGCKSLTSAPDLPATGITTSCYKRMFSGCESLASAPDLPATKLAESCYECMFSGCKSLTVAPDLPATKLENGCYLNMFSGCSHLKSVKALFLSKETWGKSALDYWLDGVSLVGTFYKNAEAVWENRGIIPDGWDVVLVTQ